MSQIDLPKAFLERIAKQPQIPNDFPDLLNSSPPISVRIHPIKGKILADCKQEVPWCENGFYLNERPSFTLDPLFHAGTYYPQEAGSMYIDAILRILDLPENPIVLDACASPGGKSTLIASFLEGKGLLLSNEIIRSRAEILNENVSKWGYDNCFVSCNDTKAFSSMNAAFDVVLIDAPCSGEGMFRKDPNARLEWTEESAANCAVRQTEILENIWPSINSGGYLIYSTCTFNPAENEEQIRDFLSYNEAELVALPQFENITYFEKNFGAQFIPGKIEAEGFYCVVLKKLDEEREFKYKAKEMKTLDLKLISFLEIPETKHVWQEEGTVFTTSRSNFEFYQKWKSKLYWMKKGIELGTVIKNKFIPDIQLALCHMLEPKFPKLLVTREEALHFLKGDVFPIATEEKGYHVIQFENVNLGFVNHLGNRFNNLYPKHWRIRMKID